MLASSLALPGWRCCCSLTYLDHKRADMGMCDARYWEAFFSIASPWLLVVSMCLTAKRARGMGDEYDMLVFRVTCIGVVKRSIVR